MATQRINDMLIDGDKLPEDELGKIKKIPGVRVVID